MTDAREYLESIRSLEIRIQMKIRQVKKLRDSLTSITAPMDKVQVTHTKNVGIMADTIAAIIDIENMIDQQTRELTIKKRDGISCLDRIQAQSANVLSGYYIEGKSTEQLGKELFLYRRQVQRRIKEAMVEFQLAMKQSSTSYSAVKTNSIDLT